MFLLGDELWTATETHTITRIDPANLETLDQAKYGKTLSVFRATAHSHTDKEGNVYTLGCSIEQV